MHLFRALLHASSMLCVGFLLGQYFTGKLLSGLYPQIRKPSVLLLWVALLNLGIWLSAEFL